MPELAIFLKPEKRPPDFAGATFADRLITFSLQSFCSLWFG